ncbi:MAG: hypothetical protein MUC65_09425 [Pontiellaceae bacterium]|jgi:hypothetical protein|nr:hypothetical protein [Pontiellaceae bacterium]
MKTAIFVLFGSTLYATVRYNVCKGVSWNDWSVYTLNKAFALSALTLLVVAVIRQRFEKGSAKDKTLSMAGLFAFMHGLLSLVLFSPVYYEKFFIQGKLTLLASWSLLFGAGAAGSMKGVLQAQANQSADRGVMKLTLLVFFIGLHAMLPGFQGWFTPSKWPGGMPPITLISFVFALIALVAGFYPRKRI